MILIEGEGSSCSWLWYFWGVRKGGISQQGENTACKITFWDEGVYSLKGCKNEMGESNSYEYHMISNAIMYMCQWSLGRSFYVYFHKTSSIHQLFSISIKIYSLAYHFYHGPLDCKIIFSRCFSRLKFYCLSNVNLFGILIWDILNYCHQRVVFFRVFRH